MTIQHVVEIAVAGAGAVSGVITLPAVPAPAAVPGVIVAHGAGNDREHPFIRSMAEGLAHAGYPCLRFNFPYREEGRKSPDGAKKLLTTWRAAADYFVGNPFLPVVGLVGAGKSMGGRVAAELAATGLQVFRRLIFFGYPLHAPGKPDKLRDAPLRRIMVPMLFFAGTRDALCNLDRLRPVLSGLKPSCRLEVISGGDHSFRLPKAAGRGPEAVYADILAKTVAWLKTCPPENESVAPL